MTFDNYRQLVSPTVIDAYSMSIKVSLTTAILGGIFRFLLAWAISMGGLPRPFRDATTTFAGVASNFAGVPLAAAFIFTLGRVGLITALFKLLGVDLYGSGFSLYSFTGLTLVYLYFQIPLMVLVIMPAIDGLKREWREAAKIWGITESILASCSAAGVDALHPGDNDPALWQCIRSPCHRLRAQRAVCLIWQPCSLGSRSQVTFSIIQASVMQWPWEWCSSWLCPS